jgi:hypothetical protein
MAPRVRIYPLAVRGDQEEPQTGRSRAWPRGNILVGAYTSNRGDSLDLSLVIVIGLLVCGLIGAAIGSSKNRNARGGFLFGAVFGVFGIIIVAVLPNGPPCRRTHPRNSRYVG